MELLLATTENLNSTSTPPPATTVTLETLKVIETKRNHPLYLHPSDTLGCVLTTVKLSGTEKLLLVEQIYVDQSQGKK